MKPLDDSIELRKKAMRMLKDGSTVAEILKELGISEQHFYRIKKKYMEGSVYGISSGYDYFQQQCGEVGKSGCYHGNSEMMTEEQKEAGDPLYYLMMLETEMEIDEMGDELDGG